MFRLILAEFKKLFYKPSLFVVTALLIFILGFSSTIYSPLKRDDATVSLQGTVNEIWSKFSTGSDAIDSKEIYDSLITRAQDTINYYKTEDNTIFSSLNNQLSEIEDALDAYGRSANAHNTTGVADSQTKTTLKNKITTLLTYYESKVKKGDYKNVVAPSSVHSSITNLLGDMLSEFDIEYNETPDIKIWSSINSKRYFTKLKNNFSQLVSYYPGSNVATSLQKYIDQTKYEASNESRLYQIYKNAEAFVYTVTQANQNSLEAKNELLEYITMYKQLCSQVVKIVIDSIDVSALSKFNESQINNFYGLENIKLYQIKEELTKNLYLYNTKSYEFQYSNVLNLTQTSNDDINAYDYSYYSLRLCSFIIIIFICVLGAGSIASEQANGTLKLLAIRPYKRSKILTAKILSIILMGFVLLIISSSVTLIIGGINYSLNSLPVLMIFDATKAFVVDVVIEYIIYLLTILLQIIIYTILSVAISTIFKSSVGSVAISIMVFFATMIFNTLSAPILVIIPLCHLDLFKYMGASFIGSANYSIIDTIFSPVVGVGFSFIASIIALSLTMIAFLVITYIIFNKRDIR